MANSPTSRTLDFLRKAGMTCQVVEQFNRFSKTRKDLFDVIDVVAMRADQTGLLGVQACAGASHAARRDKVIASPKAKLWVECGNRLWLVSWTKKGPAGKMKRWEPRIEDVTIGMFAD